MTDDTASFDLLEREWIPVRWTDGTAGEVSIRTALGSAHKIRDIGGELPTQTFAIVRLLLAILYRVADDRLDTELWRRWWEEGIPLDEVNEYLSDYADRFDLLHPTRPFFQVADLATHNGQSRSAASLISDLPAEPSKRLFTNRAGTNTERLSFAEAARWLVNIHAFDTGGIKTGVLGDPKNTTPQGYGGKLAWSGWLGGVIQEGANLHETLLLNLVGRSKYVEIDYSLDIPPWEESEPDTAAARENLSPHGPVRLFTWQSRRVRLENNGIEITGCIIAKGDVITPQNRQTRETMTAWIYSESQTRKAPGRRDVYMPLKHRADRAFWRGIGAILPATVNMQKGVAQSLHPANAEWVGVLQNLGILNSERTIQLRAIGVSYRGGPAGDANIEEVVDDRLMLALALLRKDRLALAQAAEAAVRVSKKGVQALQQLAENLAKASGNKDRVNRQHGEETAYAHLDGAYRRWLMTLGENTDPIIALTSWQEIAKRILRELGDDLIGSAGPTAWVGRKLPGRPRNELMNTSIADREFRTELKEAFGKDVVA